MSIETKHKVILTLGLTALLAVSVSPQAIAGFLINIYWLWET